MKYLTTLLIALFAFSASVLAQTEAQELQGANNKNTTKKLKARQYKALYGKWFYMPSFTIDFASAGEKNVNLYTEYARQYTHTGADYVIPQEMIKFYATGFDQNIFETSPTIDQNHVMRYKVKADMTKSSHSAYITIIAVIQ